MKPVISILEYLRSGRFGPVSIGSSRDKVLEMFGPADSTEGRLWRYGDICFEFSLSNHIERITGSAAGRMQFSSRLAIDSWKLKRSYPLTALKFCLYQEGIVFDPHSASMEGAPGEVVYLDLESGVSLEFDGPKHEFKGFYHGPKAYGRRPTCLLDRIVDTIPFYAFVLDHDARILRTSKPVHAAFGAEAAMVNHQLSGKLFGCSNAANAGGICGILKPCKECVMRTNVMRSVTLMTRFHDTCKMNLLHGGVNRERTFLATVTPFHFKQRPLALLILEDNVEIFESRKVAPVCCGCRRVQHADDSWERLEDYLAATSVLRLVRVICPSCLDKLAESETGVAS